MLIRQSQSQTGGGKLTESEKRIINSQLYSDVVDRLGASASGNAPRFDSDSTSNVVVPPTARLRRTRSSTISFRDEIDVIADDVIEDDAIDDDAFEDVDMDVARPDEEEAGPSSASQPLRRKQPAKRLSTSSRSDAKRKRSITQADILSEYLTNQADLMDLQKQYHEIQIKRAEVALETEILRKRQAEMDLEKTDALNRIEIAKQQRLADLEIAAAERNLRFQ